MKTPLFKEFTKQKKEHPWASSQTLWRISKDHLKKRGD